jgi:hypothetical protein
VLSAAVSLDAKDKEKDELEKSEKSLQADARTILRGNFNVELLQRREHLSAVHRQQRAEECRQSQAPGGSLQSSGRRVRTREKAGGAGSQSIFQQKQREKGDAKSFLDDYLPPKNFCISPQEAKEKWKNLSDLDSGKVQGASDDHHFSRFL